MKIYSENITLPKLHKKMKTLDKYLCNTQHKLTVYSIDGIFKIDENNIKKVIIMSDESKKINFFGHNLLIEQTKIKYEKMNFIPNEHEVRKFIELSYILNPKSKIKLVIEGSYDQTDIKNFIPDDFYFETQIEEELNNSLITEDLNVFLSLLN
jgi:hypothetical protein